MTIDQRRIIRGFAGVALLAVAFVVLAATVALARDDVHLVSKLTAVGPGGVNAGAKRSEMNTHEVLDVARKTSTDGRYVVFVSEAPDIIAGQTGTEEFEPQVFLRDRVAGTTKLVSHISGSNTTSSNGRCDQPGISSDGLWVSYACNGTNLVAGQSDSATDAANGDSDIFLWSQATNTNRLVSHVAATPASAGSGEARFPSISSSGRYVVYRSQATNLVTGYVNGHPGDATGNDIYRYDRDTDTNKLISHKAATPLQSASGRSDYPSISDDGAIVAFRSRGNDLVSGQSDPGGTTTDDVFVWNSATDAMTLVSRVAGTTTTAPANASRVPRVSANGQKVVFETDATNLIAGITDSNGVTDLYVFDRIANTMQLVSRSAASATTTANNSSEWARISGNGAWIAFPSNATNLVTSQSDTNNEIDIFAFNTATGTNRLLTRTAGSATTTTNQSDYMFAELTSLSDTGAYIAFSATGSSVVSGITDNNGGTVTAVGDDVFVHDTAANTTVLASRKAASATQTASGASNYPYISPDGSTVAYRSNAPDIVAGNDTNVDNDIFAFARATGTNSLVSVAGGSVPNIAAGIEQQTSASDTGRWVTYATKSTTLVSGVADANGGRDVYLYDTASRTNKLISHVPGQPLNAGNGESYDPRISGDGNWVVFASSSTNLTPSFVNGSAGEPRNVFIYNRAADTLMLVSHKTGSTTIGGNQLSEWATISDDGSRVAFGSSATDMVAGQGEAANDFDYDAFQWIRSTNTVTLASRTSTGAAGNLDSQQPLISGSGNIIVFASHATNLGHTDNFNQGYDYFTYNTSTNAVKLVNHNGNGTTVSNGQHFPGQYDISDNGQRIAFMRFGDGLTGIWLYDSALAVASQVSQVAATGEFASEPEISGSGNVVAFRSAVSNLVAGQSDTNNLPDLFVKDLATGTLRLASHIPTNNLQTGNDEVGSLNLSANGAYLSFTSEASNMVAGVSDPANTADVFMYELATNKVVFAISRTKDSDFQTAGLAEGKPTMSNGGHVVTFVSRAGTLVADDGNLSRDAFSACFPELDVNGSQSRNPVFAGGGAHTTTHTHTVVNSGPCVATQIVVPYTVNMPFGVSATAPPAVTKGTVTSGISWTIPSLEPGESATLTRTFAAAAGAVHSSILTSTIHVQSVRQLTLSAFNDISTVNTVVHNIPVDYEVLTSSTPAAAVAGQTVTLTASVRNKTSGSTATNVVFGFTTVAPAGVTTGAPVMSSGFVVDGQWHVPSVAAPPGVAQTISTTFTIPRSQAVGGIIRLSLAWLAADQRRTTNTADDSSTKNLSVTRVVDLQISHVLSAGEFVAGAGPQVVVTTSVRNNGPSDASGVTVNLPTAMPAGVVTASTMNPPGVAPGNETWNVGSLPYNTTQNRERRYDVPASAAAGNVVTSATAVATATEGDPTPGNNTIAANGIVRRVSDFIVDITETADPVVAGTPASYKVKVTNTGPSYSGAIVLGIARSAPTNSVWTFSPPNGTTYVLPNWNVGTLTVGGNRELSVSVISPWNAIGSNVIALQASVSSSEATRINTANDTQLVTTSLILESTSPSNPTLSSPTHTTEQWGVWSQDRTVDVTWPAIGANGGAADDNSGVAGYSTLWTTNPLTTPPPSTNTVVSTTASTSPTLSNGMSHWFHLRTRDQAGNWTPPIHLGPFYIDDTDPSSTPMVSPLTHEIEDWSNDTTVEVIWPAVFAEGGAVDEDSGIAGYSTQWSADPATIPDDTVDLADSDTQTASPPLEDGVHWFHLRAVDSAGNWSETVHLGPLMIDTTPPSLPRLGRLPKLSTKLSLPLTWQPTTDELSGMNGYSVLRRAGGWKARRLGNQTTIASTSTTTHNVSASVGMSYCFRIRARDIAGNLSDGNERCTALPQDDASFARVGAWQTKPAGGAFNDGKVSVSQTRGALLKRGDVTKAKRIAVVVTKCAGCGSFEVLFKGTLLKRAGTNSTVTSTSLPAGTANRRRVVIQFKPLAQPASGVLKIRVASNAKPVKIEGAAAPKF